MPTSAVAPAPTETVDAAAADQQPRPSTPARPAPITATPALMNAAPAVRLTPPTPAIAPNDVVQEDVENIESPPPSVEQAEAQADAAVVEGAAPGAESPRTVETEASTDDTAGTAAAEAAPSQVPADPQQHAPFQAAMSNLRGGAKKVKTHDPAAKKAEEAQAAAEPPANEKAAGAKAVQVDTMKSADTEKEVDKSSFLELLRAEIAKVMPKDLEEADDYMKGGDKQQLKGALKGGIEGEKEKTTGSLEAASAQAPDESKVEGKAVTPIPDTESPQPPQTIGAADAMPPQRSDEEIKPDKEDSDRMLEDADITTEQMDKANDPRFDAVNQSKGEADTYADTAPAEYRQRETDILDQASTQATDAAGRGLDAMGEARDSADSQVGGDQQTAKTKDELRRQEVTDHIEGIYKRTKERVDEKLKNLETEVFGVFDTGVETAINAMRDYVESRFDDRYSGVRGKARWLKDKILPLPDFAKAWFTQAHDRFKNDLDALVVRVANLVEQRLQEAKDEIDAGQREIKEYVDGLEGDLKEVGQAAANEINSRFDDLRKSVDDKRAGLAEQLAQRYKAATERGAKVLQELKDAHKSLLERLRDAIMEVIRILREFKDRVMSMLRKGLDTIRRIVSDPIGFLKNILAAVMQGLRQFVANIWTHLKNGFMGWLFGSLASAGIQMPREFTIGAIFGVILQILGLTYERIRAKAVRLIGERNVAIIEHVAGFLRTLFTRGPAALWEELKEFAGNLYDTVISAIQQWVITTIIRAAVTKLVSMFNPAGAIIQAIITIYNVIMFFIERINQIIEFVSAVIDSVDNIVRGNISAAANFIELALARTIPIIISFLARLIGLGGITQKIREIISSIQARVDRALDMLIAKVVNGFKRLVGRGQTPVAASPTAQPRREGSSNEKILLSFSMSTAPHRLEATVENGKWVVRMASNRLEVLRGLVFEARREEERGQKRKAVFNELENVLQRLKTVEDRNLQSDKTVDPGILENSRRDLEKIAGTLARLGQTYKLTSLTRIPHQSRYVRTDVDAYRLMPPYDTGIRGHFYPSGYTANARRWFRDRLKEMRDKARLLVPTAPSTAYYDEVAHTVVVQTRGDRTTTPTIDHKHKVADHWNSEGNNTSQVERTNFYSGENDNQANLQIASWSNNSSDGAKAASEGTRYTKEVREKFTGPDE